MNRVRGATTDAGWVMRVGREGAEPKMPRRLARDGAAARGQAHPPTGWVEGTTGRGQGRAARPVALRCRRRRSERETPRSDTRPVGRGTDLPGFFGCGLPWLFRRCGDQELPADILGGKLPGCGGGVDLRDGIAVQFGGSLPGAPGGHAVIPAMSAGCTHITPSQ